MLKGEATLIVSHEQMCKMFTKAWKEGIIHASPLLDATVSEVRQTRTKQAGQPCFSVKLQDTELQGDQNE